MEAKQKVGVVSQERYLAQVSSGGENFGWFGNIALLWCRFASKVTAHKQIPSCVARNFKSKDFICDSIWPNSGPEGGGARSHLGASALKLDNFRSPVPYRHNTLTHLGGASALFLRTHNTLTHRGIILYSLISVCFSSSTAPQLNKLFQEIDELKNLL